VALSHDQVRIFSGSLGGSGAECKPGSRPDMAGQADEQS
jgi:hypothetical protein